MYINAHYICAMCRNSKSVAKKVAIFRYVLISKNKLRSGEGLWYNKGKLDCFIEDFPPHLENRAFALDIRMYVLV